MPTPTSPLIRFHSDASPEFRAAVIDAYREVPAIVRQRLQAYAGAPTIIRTVREPFPLASGNRGWSGVSISPAAQRDHARTLPLEDRALTRLGRHQLTVTEYFDDGRTNPLPYVAKSLHHEIGHRIDFAISGDNYLYGQTGGPTFSESRAFIEAIEQDLHDAGWRPGRPPRSILRVRSRLLPQLDASGNFNWPEVAREIFADLYARRFSTSLDDQSYLSAAEATEFSIFLRTGRLVDQAVATFAGQPVMPLNPYPTDYPPGQGPLPLPAPSLAQTALGLITRRRPFEPVPPNAPHPSFRQTRPAP